MHKRAQWTTLAAALVFALATPAEAGTTEPARNDAATPRVGRFAIRTKTLFSPIPAGLKHVDFWVAAPYSDDHQKTFQFMIFSGYNAQTFELTDPGTVVAYMQGGPRGGVPLSAQTSIYVERFEEIHATLTPGEVKPLSEEEKRLMERWLKPDPTGMTAKELKSMANRITSGIKNPVGKARAIYEHLVVKMTLKEGNAKLSEGGVGDLAATFKQMTGSSIDIAAGFVALCRAVGVPARTVTGLKIPAGLRTGQLRDYHGWAEFYAEQIGWVPVDPAEASRNPAKREYYFGSLDERRVGISKGREITLAPPQAGPPLNYLVTAYWEGDSKPMRDPSQDVSFEEVDEIPQRDGITMVPTTPK